VGRVLRWRDDELSSQQSAHRPTHGQSSWGYGFLTDFRPMSSAAARDRVRILMHEYGIREFQFYDWFKSYSVPTDGDLWLDPWLHIRETSADTIRHYIDEIHYQGGRAWAYVQAIAADEADLADNVKIFPLIVDHRDWESPTQLVYGDKGGTQFFGY